MEFGFHMMGRLYRSQKLLNIKLDLQKFFILGQVAA